MITKALEEFSKHTNETAATLRSSLGLLDKELGSTTSVIKEALTALKAGQPLIPPIYIPGCVNILQMINSSAFFMGEKLNCDCDGQRE